MTKPDNGSYKNQIHVVMSLFTLLFLVMMGYFAYYVQFSSIDDINNTYNPRQETLAQKVVRGKIISADGQTLAYTQEGNGTEERIYPYGSIFAHVVGYTGKGKSGIEQIANISLLTSNASLNEKLSREMAEEKNIGDNIITTLDTDVQKTAYDALGLYKGAVVAMDPDTGRIIAMASNPGFDPNTIAKDWDELNTMTATSPLLNRATQGLYPPGSTFKIVTLLEYFRENENCEDYAFNCKGSFTYDGVTIRCYHGSVHGQIDLRTSFAKSCNSSFANIGSSLNNTSFRKTAGDLLFNEELPLKLNYRQSVFELNAKSDTEEKLHTAIGQGKTVISPLHMAMITAAIADGGMSKKPYVIDRIENYTGETVKKYEPSNYKRLMSEKEASFIDGYMKAVVQSGTGTKLLNLPYEAAGKTGSAEFGSAKGESHAWFTGYAAQNDRRLVVTVIMEGAGSGSDYAVPAAKRVFDTYFGKYGT